MNGKANIPFKVFDKEEFLRKVFTVEDAKEYYKKIYDKVCDMDKIVLKCWIAYCEYARREENAKEAIEYNIYYNAVSFDTYIGHIKSGEINCDDLGGKQAAINIVRTWFGFPIEELKEV